jgi:hypothetical protein
MLDRAGPVSRPRDRPAESADSPGRMRATPRARPVLVHHCLVRQIFTERPCTVSVAHILSK